MTPAPLERYFYKVLICQNECLVGSLHHYHFIQVSNTVIFFKVSDLEYIHSNDVYDITCERSNPCKDQS